MSFEKWVSSTYSQTNLVAPDIIDSVFIDSNNYVIIAYDGTNYYLKQWKYTGFGETAKSSTKITASSLWALDTTP